MNVWIYLTLYGLYILHYMDSPVGWSIPLTSPYLAMADEPGKHHDVRAH